MRFRKSTHGLAFILLTSCLLGREVQAGLALTPAGSQAGFGLSVFATGFPGNGTSGPLGVAFTNSGSVLVTDSAGNLRIFATDADNQVASAAPVAMNYGGNNAIGLARVGGDYYMTQQANADLVQINPNGTFNQVVVGGLPNATGLIADPLTGHLFVSTPGTTNSIYEIDPIAKTKSLFESGTLVDGLTLSSDGGTLYGASNSGHIIGFSTTTKLQVFDSGFISGGVDGTALGTGSLAGNLFVNTNFGTVYEVNLTTLATTLIASGGSRGDFVTVDPNGTLLLTQTDSIVRLTAPTGGGFGMIPEPSSLLLVGMGCLGTWIYSRRRRRGGKSA